ncbi:DUF485 domain-containing protein [Streptomyces sp. NPDC002476]|uniref:DUF485 domain-containing protein n=1 Tax=Streptomyces sp. NPDC002476 TaxID=3364648 RepID=UPI0036B91B62
MPHGNPPPPSPYSSWPGRSQQPPREHQPPTRNQTPPPQQADYLLPWQRSHPLPPLAPTPGTTPSESPSTRTPDHTPGHPPTRHGELRRLRTSYRTLRRVAALTALGYFIVFLLLSGFAKDRMQQPLFGGLNLGLALALCQLPVALLAVARYERTARRTVDPLAARLRRGGAGR